MHIWVFPLTALFVFLKWGSKFFSSLFFQKKTQKGLVTLMSGWIIVEKPQQTLFKEYWDWRISSFSLHILRKLSLFAHFYLQLALDWIHLLFFVPNRAWVWVTGGPSACCCGEALRPDRWSKSHYQVMSVGQVVGRGEPLPSVKATRAHPHWPQDPKEEPGQSEFWVTFALTPEGRRVFDDHIREKLEERSYWTEQYKRLQHLRCAQELRIDSLD